MSFVQSKLVKIENQSRGIFDKYIYKTEDSCADVVSPGYFSAARYAVTEPDKWANGIIEVVCSDGFGKGFLDSSLDFSFYIGGVASSFCSDMTFTPAATINSSGAFSGGSGSAQRLTVTNTGGGVGLYIALSDRDWETHQKS